MKKRSELQAYIKNCQQRVNSALKNKLPSLDKEPKRLHEAMTYAVLNGGKRIRSALLYATGEALNAPWSVLDTLSAAVEMIHAFSLIHDDLPAIDNDELRRGKPTCHIKYGESTAILAGDALQALGLEIITKIQHKNITPEIQLEMVSQLAEAIGSFGLIGGEELDIKMVNQEVSIKQLEAMYKLKTGCLLKASIILAVLAANCQDKKIITNLPKFAEYLGLAFQIHDDVIGIESDSKTLGKAQGADIAMHKPVYPVLVGMKQAKKMEQKYYRKAIGFLEQSGINSDTLKAIAKYIITRNF